jgi:putative membrane protein insertion efficiency factor
MWTERRHPGVAEVTNPSLLARVLITLLVIYRRLLSPLLGQNCRFHPTCSVYALDAIRAYGALRGGGMAVRRVSRCHPYHQGGLDPVP